MSAALRRALVSVSIALASLASSVTARAHHSFSAEFDVGRPVLLTGAVTEIEWTNPHAWIHIEITDGDGNRERWAVELLGINTLVRSGLSPRSLSVGDVLTISGFGARDDTNTANASSVTRTESGERLWTSSSERD